LRPRNSYDMHDAFGIFRTIWQSNRGFDRVRYLIRALIWQIRKRLGREFIARLGNGAKITVRPSSAFSSMFYERWIERKDMLFLRRNAKLAPAFVDVGANVGLFSAQLFDVFKNFYLFEPARSTFAALEKTLSLNPHISAKSFNIIVADRPGELHFIDDGDCATTSRVAKTASANTTVIAVNTLDNVLPFDVGPFVLKVDVEGQEECVFRGSEKHFRAKRPRLVMFERLERTNLERVQRFFDDMGYVLFYVDDDGTVTRDPAKVARPLVNLFASPASEFSTLAHQPEHA